MEAMLTMTPLPWLAMARAASWLSLNGAVRLTFEFCCHGGVVRQFCRNVIQHKSGL